MHPQVSETTGQTLEESAYHEAGHAVVALLWNWPIEEVTLFADGPWAGEIRLPGVTPTPRARQATAEVNWGGIVAQAIYRRRRLWHDDQRRKLAPWLVTTRHGGHWDLDVIVGMVEAHPTERRELTAGAVRSVEDFMRDPGIWQAVRVIARALRLRGRLTQADIDGMMTE